MAKVAAVCGVTRRFQLTFAVRLGFGGITVCNGDHVTAGAGAGEENGRHMERMSEKLVEWGSRLD